MELKEIKKLAEELNESGKQQLVYFLQSRPKPMLLLFVQLMKSRYKSIKLVLSGHIATAILLCDLVNTLSKHVLER